MEKKGDLQMKAYIHKVQYYETDKLGITHHSNYIRWMEEARIDYLEGIGWSYARLEEMGIASPVRSLSCRYRLPTSFNEKIAIYPSIEECNGVLLRLRYVMTDETGKTVFEGSSEHCFLNAQGRILCINREIPDFYAALSAEAGA